MEASSINKTRILGDHFGLINKVVLVTGGAAGIGAATVRRFIELGAKVIFADKNREAGTKLATEITRGGGDCHFIEADLTEDQNCKRVVEEGLTKYGRLDVLVNNAGVNDKVGLERPQEDLMASLQKNLSHVVNITRYSIQALKQAQGTIINIGSKVAETGQGGTTAYAAAKGAVLALVKEWAAEFSKFGVRVNGVIPAEVATPLYEQIFAVAKDPAAARAAVEKLIPLGRRMTKPEEIADGVTFLSSKLASHITAENLHIDGGYTHLDRALTA